MIRCTPRSTLLRAVAGAILLAASVLPAAAGFTVSLKGKTTTVTQTEAGSLIVTRLPSGDFEVSDGGPASGFPPSPNLVVRTFEQAMSYPTVVLNSALPGTLTLDLRGPSDVTVRGGVPSIGAGLKVKGGAANQIVRLGSPGAPITIDGDATFDVRDGDDEIYFATGGVVLGSLKTKGVNHIEAPTVSVGGSFSMNVARETQSMELFGYGLIVGKSFTAKGGSDSDEVLWYGGAVGRNVKIDLGDADPSGLSQIVQLNMDSIGGSVTADVGTGSGSSLSSNFSLVVKGSITVKALSATNYIDLYGTVEGPSVKYIGGAGLDDVSLRLAAPRAKATVKLGAGDDELDVDGLQVARLVADFGDGADAFAQGSFVLPPGSTLKNLP